MVVYFFAFLIGNGRGILDISGFFASGLLQNFALSFPRLSLPLHKKNGRIQAFDPNSPVLYGTTYFTQGRTYFARGRTSFCEHKWMTREQKRHTGMEYWKSGFRRARNRWVIRLTWIFTEKRKVTAPWDTEGLYHVHQRVRSHPLPLTEHYPLHSVSLRGTPPNLSQLVPSVLQTNPQRKLDSDRLVSLCKVLHPQAETSL
ncbi:hypothetical protein C7445_109121 [Alicyclobacillus sacchari]|uniref:Uncharacterized protein n=1 Tax=Alicyclobacillus sacchari TaxID=392010 RepID=A0A4R8LKI1_9BACL|nr:hypothetical protein C7445_109121 [Alicyclobacillus sacchari]